VTQLETAQATPPAVGEVAPDFTLEDQYGRPVTLSALRGSPVLLTFFPHAFSPICSGEMSDLGNRAQTPAFDGVQLLGVSCDPGESLRAFAESAAPPDMRLLSDFWPHGAVSRAYGAFFEPRGFPLRASFLIDVAGVVRWSVVNGPGDGRDADAYVAAIASLRADEVETSVPDPLP
jgi:peroxiredoxin